MIATKYPKLLNVTPLEDYELLLEFSNGERRMYDFKPNLNHTFYKELTNVNYFKKVSINDGQIEWPTGQDFCPNTLYEKSSRVN